jgi:hypothetical protein
LRKTIAKAAFNRKRKPVTKTINVTRVLVRELSSREEDEDREAALDAASKRCVKDASTSRPAMGEIIEKS